MRLELKQLQEATGITFVFVTHDQDEALALSDRIAVMSQGEVQQVGDPRTIYEAPVNRFVAGFIGETNVLDVTVGAVAGGQARIALPGGREIVAPAPPGLAPGPHHVSIRPERLSLAQAGADLAARVERLVYLGSDLQVLARLADGAPVVARLQNAGPVAPPAPGAEIGLCVEAGAARLLVD
jgi:spermidine/putrescine transport system ATP-binding protein